MSHSLFTTSNSDITAWESEILALPGVISIDKSPSFTMSKEGVANGYVVYMNGDFSHLGKIIPDDVCHGVSAYLVQPTDNLNSKALESKVRALAKGIHDHSPAPFNLAEEAAFSTAWEPSLGSGANSISVVKHKDIHRENEWYIIIRANCEEASKELKNLIATNARMTAAEMYDNATYKKCNRASQENRNRLAYKTASLLDIKVQVNATNFEHGETYETAEPRVKTNFNTLRRCKSPSGQEVFGFYNNVFRTDEASRGLFMSMGHIEGYAFYRGGPANHNNNRSWSNQHGGLWPVSIPPLSSDRVIHDMSPSDRSFVENRIVWNGPFKGHTDLANTHRPRDYAFKQKEKEMGYHAEWEVDVFKLIIKMVCVPSIDHLTAEGTLNHLKHLNSTFVDVPINSPAFLQILEGYGKAREILSLPDLSVMLKNQSDGQVRIERSVVENCWAARQK